MLQDSAFLLSFSHVELLQLGFWFCGSERSAPGPKTSSGASYQNGASLYQTGFDSGVFHAPEDEAGSATSTCSGFVFGINKT